MYYKGLQGVGIPTKNGVAVAESITGPYSRHEGNPILNGPRTFLLALQARHAHGPAP